MCYTGRCKHEITWGDDCGGCNHYHNLNFPKDCFFAELGNVPDNVDGSVDALKNPEVTKIGRFRILAESD